MSWQLSVVSVMQVLDRGAEDHLSVFIESVLIKLDVVLNTISIGINNSSWLELGNGLSVWLVELKESVVVWNVDDVSSLLEVVEMLEADSLD